MRLSQFITDRMEAILVEWEAFAATLLPAARGLDSEALRDHAHQILVAVAKDLETPQTRDEQTEKSKGNAPRIHGAPETAAQTHAVLRARGGFDINQLVAEYRALRSSVLRLWMDAAPLGELGVEDMIRFNEAIDQAIAESVDFFHAAVERYRNLLLGMLGHDMRNPLNAIIMTSSHLASLNAGETVTRAAARLIRSGASMQALLDDLTDFNRTNLGLGLNVIPSDVDMARVAADELDLLRAAHPHRRIDLAISGDSRGRWDGARVQQMLRNLVSNAIVHGEADRPVHVAIDGESPDVCVEVSNTGHIDASELAELFRPLKRGKGGVEREAWQSGLGLGLFIVKEIAKAHGGSVEARSEGEETTFAVRLPRETRAMPEGTSSHG